MQNKKLQKCKVEREAKKMKGRNEEEFFILNEWTKITGVED